jgi:hypothetical protein
MMAAESLRGFGKNGQPPANARFEAHCGLRSDIAPHPRMGQEGEMAPAKSIANNGAKCRNSFDTASVSKLTRNDWSQRI